MWYLVLAVGVSDAYSRIPAIASTGTSVTKARWGPYPGDVRKVYFSVVHICV